MKIFSLILLSLCLGLVGCSSDSSSGSSEPPAFNPAGTWDTRSNQPQPVLMVTLVLERDPTDPAKISGQWGSQGDDCFGTGSTSGYSGSMAGNQITLYLTNEANGGQITQIRATLDGIGNPPASLSGQYIVTRNDANPDCLDRAPKSVLLDCEPGTACDLLP
ncbi:MAG: hypothetical protein VX252_09020 [Myxococcota bacterium]|nr:hypothetical protein [Myxococcota bacterium]